MTDQELNNMCMPDSGPSERLACLRIVVDALSKAYSLEEVADVIIGSGLSTLGGSAGSVSLLSDDRSEFRTIRCIGFPQEIVEKYQRYAYDERVPNADVVRNGSSLFVETREERNRLYPNLRSHDTNPALKRGALAVIPLVANEHAIGALMLSFPTDRKFSEQDRTFLEIIAEICAQALERAKLYDAAQREIAERRRMLDVQKAFLRDVLLSVTEGKLHLCHIESELPKLLPQVGSAVMLSRDGGLDMLRHAASEAAVSAGFAVERAQDLMTAVSEAGMNAIIHAGGGCGRVCSDQGDVVQVWIEDQGKGIDVEDLPHATLMRGYSTAGTLGHGMKIMLQSVDSLWLLTGQQGTTVVLEQNRTAPDAGLNAFPHV